MSLRNLPTQPNRMNGQPRALRKPNEVGDERLAAINPRCTEESLQWDETSHKKKRNTMRRAYGSHRVMTQEQKARNVAESIREHRLDVNDPTTWTRYGLADNHEQRARVLGYLALATKSTT